MQNDQSKNHFYIVCFLAFGKSSDPKKIKYTAFRECKTLLDYRLPRFEGKEKKAVFSLLLLKRGVEYLSNDSGRST